MSASPGRSMGPRANAGEDDILRQIGKSWGWILCFGIVTIGIGIVITVRPLDTIYFFAVLLGIWFFVSGLFRIVMAIAEDDGSAGARWFVAVLGLLSVIVGLFFLRRTYETVATLAFLIGLFWIIGGIIEFFTAYTHRGGPARGWRIVLGLLAFAAGVATLVVPSLTLVTLTMIMGIWLIVYGVAEIFLSLRLRMLAAAG